jgi:hypothetical protein
MRLSLAAALLALPVLASPAAAQRSGTYAVVGAGSDGARYEGALTLQATGPATWRITWRIGGETITGTALTVGNLLVSGYVHGRQPGVVAYELQPDGRLVGRWTSGTEGGVGTETLFPR